MTDILGYKGKRVIVSGCFSGMGEATAKILLSLGAEVHGFDYKDVDLPLASFNKVDLRDAASIEAGVAAVGGSTASGSCPCHPEKRAISSSLASSWKIMTAAISWAIPSTCRAWKRSRPCQIFVSRKAVSMRQRCA